MKGKSFFSAQISYKNKLQLRGIFFPGNVCSLHCELAQTRLFSSLDAQEQMTLSQQKSARQWIDKNRAKHGLDLRLFDIKNLLGTNFNFLTSDVNLR